MMGLTLSLSCSETVEPLVIGFWNAENLCFLPADTNENITMIGSARGIWNKEDCIKSGIAGASEAMNRLGLTKTNYFFPQNTFFSIIIFYLLLL